MSFEGITPEEMKQILAYEKRDRLKRDAVFLAIGIVLMGIIDLIIRNINF